MLLVFVPESNAIALVKDEDLQKQLRHVSCILLSLVFTVHMSPCVIIKNFADLYA